MAFFDKLNQVAKNIGDKTNDAIETAKFFNLCQSCGKWVCDDCYDIRRDCCTCRECEAHESS